MDCVHSRTKKALLKSFFFLGIDQGMAGSLGNEGAKVYPTRAGGVCGVILRPFGNLDRHGRSSWGSSGPRTWVHLVRVVGSCHGRHCERVRLSVSVRLSHASFDRFLSVRFAKLGPFDRPMVWAFAS